MSAMTEMPANTPRPMGSTSSFLPGNPGVVLAAWSLARVAVGLESELADAGSASPAATLVAPTTCAGPSLLPAVAPVVPSVGSAPRESLAAPASVVVAVPAVSVLVVARGSVVVLEVVSVVADDSVSEDVTPPTSVEEVVSVVDDASAVVVDEVSVDDSESVLVDDAVSAVVVDDESTVDSPPLLVLLPLPLPPVLSTVPPAVKRSMHVRVSFTKFWPLTTTGSSVTWQSSVIVPPGTAMTLCVVTWLGPEKGAAAGVVVVWRRDTGEGAA